MKLQIWFEKNHSNFVILDRIRDEDGNVMMESGEIFTADLIHSCPTERTNFRKIVKRGLFKFRGDECRRVASPVWEFDS